MHNVKILIETV